MNKSELINELAGALSKLQGEINDVFKGKKGYGYNYADLASILEEARPLLAKHGLSVSQLPAAADEKVVLETLLMHSSGQWVSSTIEMIVEKGKGMSSAQAVGSVITYARRYALAAILGIAQTDDDASTKINCRTPYEEAYEKIRALGAPKELVLAALATFGVAKISDLQEIEIVECIRTIERLMKNGPEEKR